MHFSFYWEFCGAFDLSYGKKYRINDIETFFHYNFENILTFSSLCVRRSYNYSVFIRRFHFVSFHRGYLCKKIVHLILSADRH